MKNIFFAIIISGLLIGCSAVLDDDDDIVFVDPNIGRDYHSPALTDYVSIFKQISGKSVINTPHVDFLSLVSAQEYHDAFNSSILGICFASSLDGFPVAIILNDVYFDWSSFTEAYKLHIFIHEMIHCEYTGIRKEHQSDINDIMNPFVTPIYEGSHRTRVTVGQYDNESVFKTDTDEGEFFYRLIANNYDKFDTDNITIAELKAIIPLSQL